jgi:putative ABC transport system permease protein
MFDLDNAIREWTGGLRRHDVFEEALIADLELQLRDAAAALKGEGLPDEEAFRRAVAQVGSPEMIAAEYRKNRMLARDRRSPWRPARFVPALAGNYLKTAWRKMKGQKGVSFINVAGLAVGLACALLVIVYARHELSYDRAHANRDRIFRLATGVRGASYEGIAKVPGPWGPAVLKDLPEVRQVTRFVFVNETLVARGDVRSYESGGLYADPSVFEVFTFPLLAGDPATALEAPGSVVVTESFARKYFGDEDPMGRPLTFNVKDEYVVRGVMADVPPNSHFTFDFLVSLTTYKNPNREDWHWQQFYTYLLLRDGASPGDVAAKVPGVLGRNMAADRAAAYTPFLQPLTDIHLRSNLFREMEPNSDIATVTLFSAVAFFVLLVACFNFMNLTTARALTRAKEVGVRKAAGAGRRQLAAQFLGESALVGLIALAVAVLAAGLALPAFGALMGRPLALPGPAAWRFWLTLVGLALVAGGASGLYPAVVLSAFRPADALKGRSVGPKRQGLRRALVTTQFAISIVLIIATGVVTRQLDYVRTRRLGFNPAQLVVIPLRDEATRTAADALKREFLKDPRVLAASASANLPGGSDWGMPYEPEGFPKDQVPPMRILAVDQDFVETYELKVAAGRDFSGDHASDATGAFLINEEAARALGWADPIGRTITLPAAERSNAPVIGVLEDFHFRSLKERIGPVLLFVPPPDWFTVLTVRIGAGDIRETMAAIERAWSAFDPVHPFAYSFMDERFARLYASEERMGRLLGDAAGLAVLVGCLGLFGLAAFSAEQRTKEIGIRKVLGASVWSVVRLLSVEVLVLVGLANLIAWPAALFAMRGWLQRFAYRAPIRPVVFMISALLAMAIALLTVSWQSVKAGLANPIDSLRDE